MQIRPCETIGPSPVYDDVAPAQHRRACVTLEAHLIKLELEGCASLHGGPWRPGP